jgi:putative FmdB family regulatory protein
MPTYEYRCSAGHEFELLQRMSEEPLRECRICGAPAERLLSAGAGLLFKGSGFYITDYRSESYRKAAAAESGAGSGAADAKASEGGGKAGAGEAKAGGGSKPGGSGASSDGGSVTKSPKAG